MSLNLTKNSTFNLSKDKPLNIIKLLATWSKSQHQSKFDYDLDVFALALDSKTNQSYFENLCYPTIDNGKHNSIIEGTMVHGGDEQKEGTEFLTINLSKIPQNFDNIIVGLNIYNNIKRDAYSNIIEVQNFSAISNEKVEIIDMDNNKVIAVSDSSVIEKVIKETPTVDKNKASLFELGTFVRDNSNWLFKPSFIVTDTGLEVFLQSKNMVG
jgi:stress response protein SCP2